MHNKYLCPRGIYGEASGDVTCLYSSNLAFPLYIILPGLHIHPYFHAALSERQTVEAWANLYKAILLRTVFCVFNG